MTSQQNASQMPAPRKLRLAIMGEFSSGKSTLTNLLLGADPLPTKVTATQLPPVWIAQGTDDPFLENTHGQKTPFHIQNLAGIDLKETRLVRLFLTSDILQMCDLIDMPGISDPNMPAEIWEGLIAEIDCVIWCTPANQSWRQSEAALWDSFPKSLQDQSLLLITHSDKLRDTSERDKVLKRVRRETDGLFAGIYPISVTQAIAAQEDQNAWENSGADAFVNHLVDILTRAQTCVYDRVAAAPETSPYVVETGIPPRSEPLPARSAQTTFTTIKTKDGPKTPRPTKEDAKTTFQDVYFGTEEPDHRVNRRT